MSGQDSTERRWEISVLIGPCTEAERDAFFERATDNAGAFDLGAVWSCGPYDEGEVIE